MGGFEQFCPELFSGMPGGGPPGVMGPRCCDGSDILCPDGVTVLNIMDPSGSPCGGSADFWSYTCQDGSNVLAVLSGQACMDRKGATTGVADWAHLLTRGTAALSRPRGTWWNGAALRK